MRGLLKRILAVGGTGVLGFGMIGVYIGSFVGWAYWMWIAIQVGSFWMFVVGLIPPGWLVASFLGLWSLLFGVPMWLVHAAVH
jgi:hypothetical protein